MKEVGLKYKKLVLICTNEREELDCCARRGAAELFQKLKAAIKAADPDVRVSRTGCLGNCLTGVSVVIMPDDIWLGEVVESDIDEIVNLVTR